MPSRLRPVASVAADAVLVGDPGRALLLAQELQDSPKMSNHARGLWGYWGTTPSGRELTVQSTGMGGPSAALVLADLAELGVRRAVRVGTCAAIAPEPEPGELLVALEAHAWGAGREGEAVLPDGGMTEGLRTALAEAEAVGTAVVASLDFLHSQSTPGAARGAADAVYAERADAADMQTAALMLEAQARGVAFAAVLIVAESAAGEQADDELLEAAAKRAGRAAAKALETLN